MTKKLFNFFISLGLLATLCVCAWAQEAQKYYYSHSKDCWIKRYRNQKIEYVDDAIFYKIELIAKPLKNNPQIRAFKYNGEMHIVPLECLEPILEQDPSSELEELKNSSSETSKAPAVRHDDYFLEIGSGLAMVGATSSIYPKYDTDLSDFVGKKIQLNADGSISKNNAGTITVNSYQVPENSSYTTKPIISLGIGVKREDNYLMFRFKQFSATKEEVAKVAVTDTASSLKEIILTNTFKDTISNFMIGSKYLFNPNGKYRPSFAILLGLSKLDSEFDYIDYKLSSTGFAASVDVGLEYFYSSRIAYSAKLGYEYLAHKQLTGTNPATGSTEGFDTGLSYNNTFLSLSALFYW